MSKYIELQDEIPGSKGEINKDVTASEPTNKSENKAPKNQIERTKIELETCLKKVKEERLANEEVSKNDDTLNKKNKLHTEQIQKGIDLYTENIKKGLLSKPLFIGSGFLENNCVRFCPNGNFFAVACLDKRGLRYYNVQTHELVWDSDVFIRGVSKLEFIANGNQILALGTDGLLKLFNVQDGTLLNHKDLPNLPQSSIFTMNKNDSILAIGQSNGDVSVIDWSTRIIAKTIKFQNNRVTGLVFNSNGDFLAISLSDGKWSIINMNTMETDSESGDRYHNGGIKLIAFSPDDKWLVTGGYDKKVKIYDIAKKTVLEFSPEKLNEKVVIDLRFGMTSKFLFTCSADGYFKTWETKEKGKEVGFIFNKDYKGFRSFDINNDESKVILATNTHIFLYDYATKNPIKDYFSGFEQLTKSLFNSNGSIILSLSIRENLIKINDAETGKEMGEPHKLKCLDEKNNPLRNDKGNEINISYDDFTVQTSNDYGSYYRYCASYSREDGKFGVACFECYYQKDEETFINKNKVWDKDFEDQIFKILYSSDGNLIIGATKNQRIYIIENKSGENQNPPYIKLPVSSINDFAFSCSEGVLVVCGGLEILTFKLPDKKVNNAEPLQITSTLKHSHRETIQKIVLSPDVKLIASSDYYDAVILIDFQKKQEIFKFKINSDAICLAFSNNCDKLVSAGAEIKIYDLETKKKLLKIPYLNHDIMHIQFSKDGKKFLAVRNCIEIFETNANREDKKFFGKEYYIINKIQFNKAEDKFMLINNLNQFKVFDYKTNQEILTCSRSFKSELLNFTIDDNENYALLLGDFISLFRLNNFKNIQEIKMIDHSYISTCTRTGLFSKGLTETIIIGSDDGMIRHLSFGLEKIKESDKEKSHKDWVREIIAHPLKNEILSASDDSTVNVWKEDTLELLRTIKPGHSSYIYCLALSKDGNFLFTGSSEKELFVNDLRKVDTHPHMKIEAENFHSRAPISVKMHPKSELLFTASEDGELKIWRTSDLNLVKKFKFQKGCECNFNKDGTKILVGSGMDISVIIRVNQQWQVEQINKEDFQSGIRNLLITPDAEKIIAVDETDLTVLSFHDCKILNKINIDEKLFKTKNLDIIQGLNNNCFLIIASSAGMIKVYDINRNIEEKSFLIEGESIRHLKFINETTIMLINSLLRIFDISGKNPTLIGDFKLEKPFNNFGVYIDETDGKNVKLAFNYESKIHSYSFSITPSPKSLKLETIFEPIQPVANTSYQILRYSPKGDRIYLLSLLLEDQTRILLVLDSSSGYIIKSHPLKHNVYNAEFSPDCSILAFWDDSHINIINTETFIINVCSSENLSELTSIRFTKDSHQIVASSNSTRITFLNMEVPSYMNDFLIVYEKLKRAEKKNLELSSLDIDQILNRRVNIFALLGPKYSFNIFHLICLYNDEKVLKHFLKNISAENSDLIYSLLNHRDFLEQTPYQMAATSGNTKLIETLIKIHIKTKKQSRFFSGFPCQTETLISVLNYYPSYLASFIDSQLCIFNRRKFLNLPLELEEKTMLKIFATKFTHLETINSSILIQTKEEKKIAFSIQVLMINDILIPKNSFMNDLSEKLNEDHNIFDSTAFTAVLKYKWENFGKKKFHLSLAKYIIYFILVLISSLVLFPMRRLTFLPFDMEKNPASQNAMTNGSSILSPTQNVNMTDTSSQKEILPPELNYNQNAVYIASMIFDITTLIYLYIAIVTYEVKVFLKRKSKYFSNGVWNFLDVLIIITGTSSMIFDIILLTQNQDPAPNTVQTLKFLFFFNLLITWIRMADFWRGFRTTAALVRLLTRVFADMKAFFLVLFYLLLGFSMSTYLLQNNYEGYGKWGFIKMYYNLILGNTDDFESMTQATSVFEDLFFIIFFILTVFLIIVMLNLLIAIISDTHSKVNSVEAKAFQFERLSLINEYEETMDELEEKELIDMLQRNGNYLYVIKSSRQIPDDEDDINELDRKNPSDKMEVLFGEMDKNKETMQSILELIKKNQEETKNNQESLRNHVTEEIKKLIKNKPEDAQEQKKNE